MVCTYVSHSLEIFFYHIGLLKWVNKAFVNFILHVPECGILLYQFSVILMQIFTLIFIFNVKSA